MDERFNELGKRIWERHRRVEAYLIAKHLLVGAPELIQMREDEDRALWGDLQTLFRGGVFPEDLPPMEEPK